MDMVSVRLYESEQVKETDKLIEGLRRLLESPVFFYGHYMLVDP